MTGDGWGTIASLHSDNMKWFTLIIISALAYNNCLSLSTLRRYSMKTFLPDKVPQVIDPTPRGMLNRHFSNKEWVRNHKA